MLFGSVVFVAVVFERVAFVLVLFERVAIVLMVFGRKACDTAVDTLCEVKQLYNLQFYVFCIHICWFLEG